MRELSKVEQFEACGGNAVLAAVATAVLIYEAADILYEFGQGVVEGYNANDKV